jgi:hypothetical protein
LQAIPDTSEDEDRFGQALTIGDYDGDGRADLAIGVPREDDRRGVVQILYATGFVDADYPLWTQNYFGRAAQPDDLLGGALA